MGILDKLKGQASGLKKKATEVVDDNSDTIQSGLDKAGDFADEKTKGKYSDKIDQAKGVAEKGLDKLDGQDDDFAPDHSHDQQHSHDHVHGDDAPHSHPHDHAGEHTHEHPQQ